MLSPARGCDGNKEEDREGGGGGREEEDPGRNRGEKEPRRSYFNRM